MTETSTPLLLPVDPAVEVPPGNLLLKLIVAVLAPMFLNVADGNAEHARMAALETINHDRVRSNGADLIAVAQIIAFGLAALSSLSQSMVEELAIGTALRLRGNANGLNRSADQIRKTLGQDHVAARLPDPDHEAAVVASVADTQKRLAAARAAVHAVTEAQAAVTQSAATSKPAPPNKSIAARNPSTVATTHPPAPFVPPAPVTATPAAPAAAPSAPTMSAAESPAPHALPAAGRQITPATPPRLAGGGALPSGPSGPAGDRPLSDRQRQMLWAAAMSDVAREFTDSLPNLPRSERWAVSRKAAALSSCANHLIAGVNVPTIPEIRTPLHPTPKQGGKRPD